MNGNDTEHHVSTEAQRLALEAMSAQLVHKLNAMISEQEERVRVFSEQHHSTLPVPQVPKPEVSSQVLPQVEQTPQVALPPTPYPAPEKAKVTPPPPATRRPAKNDRQHDYTTPANPEQKSLRIGPKKNTATEQEEGNIGIGMIIFALVGIILLLRACS
ncbi:MAG: hypothetical protein IKY91_10170 [Akkermansia sp.]|nr:hypothetical protein [Akkermansia sp.]